MSRRFSLASIGVLLFLLLALITAGVAAADSFVLASDLRFENALLGNRAPFLVYAFRAVTLLGDIVVVIGIAGIIGIFLYFSKLHRAYIAGLAATLVSAIGINFIMKELVERVRPESFAPSALESAFSFPSGHATFSVALYGFVTYLLCKRYPENATVLISTAIMIILVVGFSRLYLGMHFLSDVLAGYLLGGLCLLFGIWMTKKFGNGNAPQTKITRPN
ncbi:hypothetical protein A3I46_01125 [Candidatus Kaiserbacteria bacterium RIFCSPLOWO2_02_FULL_54_13]|uniref:Phosphatidic acid phosphatase type 2/haloperoxidase domain-containing protein n=1 Tax=Candidatus Kaiserbacteria bacterium RIFCSPHIGHO2_02_FULL_54_22 TaxID=1798495 RepID=A0A1F6DN21_9BACT|nr:MAG: hypothetical protein A3C19_03380 [Candidatus Kaiserbacteria bacterium RIFCSPHIGHO2_02_FULL_54_22]OGG67891.1 MAG: hypothetical protein A3E99_03805 [Candidatus Kaiserbacteria bacterium RIFCSPHIGHO2_12_FULL_54_16]OGG83017.1 MAG: hypothetical protein A3I46_01125 [Candidatus Kaiserbacteria bacterium RIFCSPLOWO2_02_FULL_54_13]OGG90199.1 MAG: hypothetical protein A3G12_02355 [Candidatus Kaiserbacteria bacterium RIFCSPLOWO2_12_FULL_54_10]